MPPSTVVSLTPVLEHLSQTLHAQMHEIVCNEVKTMQGSRICVVCLFGDLMGLTCLEYCKDIRVLLYSDGQRKRTAEFTSLRALRRHLVKVSVEQRHSYVSSGK